MDPDKIAEYVEPYPLDLWRWGCENRQGRGRELPQEIIRYNLLPRDELTVTPRGLRFKDVFYSCDRAVREGWFLKAKVRGTWKEPIVYDPRDTDILYLDRDGKLEECRMLERSQTTFQGRTWQEVDDYIAVKQMEDGQAETREQEAAAELNARLDRETAEAQAKTAAATENVSDRARVTSLREYRSAERQARREEDVWRFEPDASAEDEVDDVIEMAGASTAEPIAEPPDEEPEALPRRNVSIFAEMWAEEDSNKEGTHE
jgi:hypothetical protein